MISSRASQKCSNAFANVVVFVLTITLMSLFLVIPAKANDENTNEASLPLTESVNIDDIQSGFIDLDHGYLYMGSKLFWTENAGATWSDITPSGLENATVLEIQFADTATGYVLIGKNLDGGVPSLEIYETTDGGENWRHQSLDLPYPVEISPFIDKASLFMIGDTWWISIKVSSSSNFSIGLLFRTDDAGATWRLQTAPVGEPVYFVTPESGWMAGGPAGDELYKTTDGGDTWESVILSEVDGYLHNGIQTPHFSSPTDGILIDLVGETTPEKALVFTTSDGGENWSLSTSIAVQNIVNHLAVAYPKALPRSLIMANGSDLIEIKGNGIPSKKIPLPPEESPTKLFFFDDQIGFVEVNHNSCSPVYDTGKAKGFSCKKEYQILRTNNGGQSWASINLPVKNQKSLTQSLDFTAETSTLSESSTYPSLTKAFIGQGFDKCELATGDQLSDWYTNSPYRAVNLYIGGKSRACSNTLLTASNLQSLGQKGWSFIPTWVGYQAPCSGLSRRMSYDPTIAYGQGVEEATSAIEQLSVLGLSNPDKSGSVVYYDMEYYNGLDTACSAAVSSFMNGWTSQLHAFGIFSGIYGSTSNNQLNNILAVPNPPDVIWPARWYAGTAYYKQDASIWEIPGLSNSIYNVHQRIRQYYGGHNETWGSTTLLIDNDVIDSILATPQQASVQACPSSTESESYACVPTVAPVYSNTCDSGWFPIIGFNGLASYLAENVKAQADPTNISNWTTNLLADGNYRVEAFIPAHGSSTVTCSSKTLTYGKDSSKANYLITDKDKITTSVLIDQLPINNDWVNLGIYSFGKGANGGSVTLTNVTSEDSGTTNISAGAIRFIAVDPKISSIFPNEKLVNDASFTLTVTGQNFNPLATVRWNGSDRLTTFINSTLITAQIPDTDLEAAAIAPITVFDPSTNLTSSPVQFFVTTFADVPPTHIFWRYIEGFYAEGITTGCSTNPMNFCPDNPVTRSAMAVFLLRAKNGTGYQPPAATGIFTDLPVVGKEWMQPWVEEFYREGITTGCSADPLQYCPENSVTRAAMAVFLLRAKYGADYQPPAATGIFTDLPVTGKEWMEPWIEQFYREGITTGCGVDPLRYCPEDPVKRQAMAVFIDRAFGIPQLP